MNRDIASQHIARALTREGDSVTAIAGHKAAADVIAIALDAIGLLGLASEPNVPEHDHSDRVVPRYPPTSEADPPITRFAANRPAEPAHAATDPGWAATRTRT